MSKVLILGGTGAMGGYLRDKLADRGYDVYVTSRKIRDDKGGVSFICGNAKDDTFLKQVLANVKPDAVVDFMNYGTLEFMNRRDVLLAGTGHYLFLSSCRVFAGEEIHVEGSPRLLDVCDDEEYLKTDEYGLSKAREENLLRESGKRNWTIIRPCITYASPRFQFGCLESDTFVVRALQGIPSAIPETMLDKKTTMMWGGDTAEMIARLVLNDKALGEDFNTVTAEHHTWREVGEIYKKQIGLEYKVCSQDDYSKLCSKYQMVYGRMVDHAFNNRKVLQITGLRQNELRPLSVGLGEEIVLLMSNPSTLGIDIRRNALLDRMLGTKVALSKGLGTRCQYYSVKYPIVGTAMACACRIKNKVVR